MMISTFYCNCCGFPISNVRGDDCPRCGYPITASKEKQFLESSLLALQRVAAYGGANITISQLINRYRTRLNFLYQSRMISSGPALQNPSLVETPGNTASSSEKMMPAPPVAPPPQVTSTPVLRPQSARSFSLASFLEEQTINIVASLGAFLILVGALSFVATTTNLLLSFLMIFIVHAIFGAIGIISYRFPGFRTVAAIYTAIFALLVPLVGFSAYRLVSGNLAQFSTSALVAIAATYAMLAYGALAVYQKFSPFGYLALTALIVAALAMATAFHLGYWWWPSIMMVPALPALLSVPRRAGDVRPFVHPWTILREPVLVFMGICVAVCVIGIPTVFIYAMTLDTSSHAPTEIRVSLGCMILLLLIWNCLFVWRTKRPMYAQSIPYLFLGCALAFSYALLLRQVGYVLMLTAVALLYHGLTRFAPQFVRSFKETGTHLEGLALLLVALVPFITVPLLPLWLAYKEYVPGFQALPFSWDLVVELVAIIIGVLLTISVVLKHTGLRRVPEASRTNWRWLLLFSGFLLNTAYGLFLLLMHMEPVWWLAGLSLMLLLAAVIMRRFGSALWAHPLDTLALVEIVCMLLLSFNQGADRILVLWLSVALVLYTIILYQRRSYALFLPVFFAVLIVPLTNPLVLLVASIVLPLAAAGIQRCLTARWNVFPVTMPAQLRKNVLWEWPLLAIGVFYGIVLALHDTSFASLSALPTSTVEGWLHIHFPVSLELITISLFWYLSAVLARMKWWLIAVVGSALAALLIPGNPFWILAWVAPILVVLALGVSRLAGRDWAVPLYIIAVFAALIMGVAGYKQGQVVTATWVLLLFATFVYLIGVVQQSLIGLWIAPFFALWSALYSGQLGDLYRLPAIALLCAALGVGIGCLRFFPLLNPAWKMRCYALPLYATACGTAVLTGVYRSLSGVSITFFAAIPIIMLVYALVAYGVILFERRAHWQWLVFAFGTWSILLLPAGAFCSKDVSFFQSLTPVCMLQASNVFYYLAGAILITGMMGFLTGLVSRCMIRIATGAASTALQVRFNWNWSWYSIMLVALLTLFVEGLSVAGLLPINLLLEILCLLTAFLLVLTVLERAPEMLLLPFTLTVWIIALTSWPLWQRMIAYSLLCVLIFAAQFVWRVLTPRVRIFSPTRLYQGLSIGGQVVVILAIIVQGGLFVSTGLLVHVGTGALLVLAALIFCYGLLDFDTSVRRICNYSTGLLCSLVFSWELAAFGLSHLDWLTLMPAIYLIVVSPFLSRDSTLRRHHLWGQFCSIGGAALLLLPMLEISFSEGNLTPTLILAGEALALFLLGITTHIRIFVLSGAALTIVGAMHALFLPSLGIPTSLALTLLGASLLAIATGLSLARRRITSAWTEWE